MNRLDRAKLPQLDQALHRVAAGASETASPPWSFSMDPEAQPTRRPSPPNAKAQRPGPPRIALMLPESAAAGRVRCSAWLGGVPPISRVPAGQGCQSPSAVPSGLASTTL
jgi:hypothetical protein